MALKIHTTIITTAGGNTIRYFTRHNSSRQAQAHVLEGKVETHVTTQDELIDMVKSGIEPGGLQAELPDSKDLPFPNTEEAFRPGAGIE